MPKVLSFILALLLTLNAQAAEISAEALKLTPEQNQKLTELKERLHAEITPIWEEIKAGKQRITEIEKTYFEEFWTMLSEEQRATFSSLNTTK